MLAPEQLLEVLLAPSDAQKHMLLKDYAPIWRHPLYVDMLAATAPLSTSTPLPSPQQTRGKASGIGLAPPLSFIAEVLESTLPVLEPTLRAQAAQAAAALREGAQLSEKVPVNTAASSTSRKGGTELLRLLETLVGRLRLLDVGGSMVVPAGWTYAGGGGAQCSSLLLAVRRESEEHWSIAVCTASAGLEYHPRYRQPLVAEQLTDPGMHNETQTDPNTSMSLCASLLPRVSVDAPTSDSLSAHCLKFALHWLT